MRIQFCSLTISLLLSTGSAMAANGLVQLSLTPIAGRHIEGTISSIFLTEELNIGGPPGSAASSGPSLSELLKATSIKTLQDYNCSTAYGPDAKHVSVRCSITTTKWITPHGSNTQVQAGQSSQLVAEALYDLESSAYRMQTYSGAKSPAIAMAQMLAAIHGIMSVPKALEQLSLTSGETSRFELDLPMPNGSHKALVLSRIEGLSESTATVHSSTTLTPEASKSAAASGTALEYDGDSTGTFRRDDGVLLTGQARMKFRMRLGSTSGADRKIEIRFTTDITQAATESTPLPGD